MVFSILSYKYHLVALVQSTTIVTVQSLNISPPTLLYLHTSTLGIS